MIFSYDQLHNSQDAVCHDRRNSTNTKTLISLPLAGWSFVAPSGKTVAAELPLVDAMLRRRLSGLSKMAIMAAASCLNEIRPPVHTIFASRHGEITGTMSMLHNLSRNVSLSPAAFSLSVHSTAVSLFTVARADHASFTAVSAGADTFFLGLQEAAGQLARQPSLSLLMLYADEVLPEELGRFSDPADRKHALALHFNTTAMRSELVMQCDMPAGERNTSQPAIAFAGLLEAGKKVFHWNGSRHSWAITLNEKTR